MKALEESLIRFWMGSRICQGVALLLWIFMGFCLVFAIEIGMLIYMLFHQ